MSTTEQVENSVSQTENQYFTFTGGKYVWSRIYAKEMRYICILKICNCKQK